MFKQIYVLICLLIVKSAFSQSVNWQWVQNSSCSQSDGFALGFYSASDEAGNVYVTGCFADTALLFGTQTLNGQNHGHNPDSAFVYIVKYDANGNTMWAKKANGLGYSDARGIAIDASGNIFVSGFFTEGDISFDTDTLSLETLSAIFLLKLDPAGNTIWTKKFNTFFDLPTYLATSTSGDVYMIGDFSADSIVFDAFTIFNSSLGSSDIFLVKFDSSGNVLWANGMGGPFIDFGGFVSVDPDGNSYLTGIFWNYIVIGTDTLHGGIGIPDNSFIAKLDPFGNTI